MLTSHRSLTSYMFVVFTVIAIILMSSCLYPIDPAAKTPGYKLFTGRTEGFRISFEYPDTWQRQAIEKHDAFRIVSLFAPGLSIGISSNVTISNGGRYANVGDLIQHILDIQSGLPDFHILSHTKARLGQAEGEEILYSYSLKVESDPHLPPGTVLDISTFVREVAVEYRERIYDIDIHVDIFEYENYMEGLEHLMATFCFLE